MTRPNHRMDLEMLARMSPSERLRKAFELSDFSKRLFMQELRNRYSDLSTDDFRKVIIERLTRGQNEEVRIGKLAFLESGVQ